MNIGELKALIKDLPDDTFVLCESDECADLSERAPVLKQVDYFYPPGALYRRFLPHYYEDATVYGSLVTALVFE